LRAFRTGRTHRAYCALGAGSTCLTLRTLRALSTLRALGAGSTRLTLRTLRAWRTNRSLSTLRALGTGSTRLTLRTLRARRTWRAGGAGRTLRKRDGYQLLPWVAFRGARNQANRAGVVEATAQTSSWWWRLRQKIGALQQDDDS